MTTVNSNIAAKFAMHAMGRAETQIFTAQNRLSSGLRLNSAADDAAGNAVAGKLLKDTQSINIAIRNSLDMQGALSVVDSAYENLEKMLVRMRELATQAASGSYSNADRVRMDAERASLLREVNNIADSTYFNKRKLLDGTFKDIITQAGPSGEEVIDVDIEKIQGERLGRYWELGFTNNDFSSATPVSTSGTTVSIPGWTIELQQVALGPDGGGDETNRSIGTLTDGTAAPTPTDPTPTPSNGGSTSRGDDWEPSSAGNMRYEFSDGSIRLYSTGMTSSAGGDVIHGPYIVSNDSVSLTVGDKVTFNWKAANGADAFDVYAYLLNVADGSTVELLDETANGSTDWATAEVTLSTTGDYKFVFVAGTFDYTFGRALGASLYIDDVDVESASGPEVVVEYINVLDQESARTAIGVLDTASEQLATFRAYVGALHNRITSAIGSLSERLHNERKAIGRITDADLSAEIAASTKNTILKKASTNVLINAQTAKRALLKLI